MNSVQSGMDSGDTSEARLGIGIHPARKGRFALGLLTVFFAQFIFLQRTTPIFNFGLMTWVMHTFFINFAAPGNRLTGVIFFGAGALLLWTSICIPQRQSPPGDRLPQPVGLFGFLRRRVWFFVAIGLLLAYLLTQLVQLDTAVGLVLVWIAIMLLALWLARAYDQQSGARLSLHIDRRDLIAVIALFGIGLLISSYQLTQIPNTYNDDEPEFLYEMNAIVQGREGRSFFAPGVFDFPLASNYGQALSFSLLGVSLFSWRFASVFSGMLALFPMYILTREMFNRRTAILAGILLITLPYFIAFNRMGYNNSQALLPTAWALCFLYIGLKRRSLVYMALGGIGAGIGFYTYTGARIALVIAVLFFACLFLAKLWRMLRSARSSPERSAARRDLFGILGMGIVYGLVAALVLVPQLVYASAIQPNLSNPKVFDNLLPNVVYADDFFTRAELFRDYPPITYLGQTFFFRPDLYLILFLRGLILTVLAFQDSSVANLNFILGPLTGLISAAFYGIGLVIAFKKLRDERYLLLLLWIGCTMFFLSILSTQPPRQTHLVPIIPALSILTAVGLVCVIDFVSERIQASRLLARIKVSPITLSSFSLARIRLSEALLTVGLLSVIIVPNLKNYFVDVPPFYPPEIEHVIAWGALNAPVPTTLIFANAFLVIGWREVHPRLSEIVGAPSKLVKVDIDDLVQGRYRFLPNQPYIIYCLAYDWPRMQKYMRTLPQSLNITPINHTDRFGRVTIVEFAFTAPADMPAPVGYPLEQ